MKDILLVVSVIIGTLIGAGFASGKEIEIFFGKYGFYGMIGIIISACLIGAIIYCVLKISNRYSIEKYDEFLDFIMNGTKKIEDKQMEWIKKLIKNVINLFLLISFFIMIAGFGSYFYQEFHIAPIIGAILLSILCYITFMKGIKGITEISSILMPILVGFILFIGLTSSGGILVEFGEVTHKSYSWFISAILYGSYNTILVIPILFPLKKYMKDPKKIKRVCTLSVFIIILLATIICRILIDNYDVIVDKEIPMLYVVGRENKNYKYLYGILILISIYTSAISAGYGFLQNSVRKRYQKGVSIAICIVAIFISNFGFTSLVNLLYPILGVIGLLQIYRILKCLKST